jgi:RNA polymerase sigma factor (sigma-70 family)
MEADPVVEELVRRLTPEVIGAVVRRYGRFDLAEDAVQEALLAAAIHWPRNGVPEQPKAWLLKAAGRRMTDTFRSEQARSRRETALAVAPSVSTAGESEDDTLVLLLLCCHPVLTPASAIALTLRAVGGLTTAEIGRAFLVPEATMAQRITRAKQKIRSSGLPFVMPAADELPERLRSVLHVLYLVFNEGYTSSAGRRLRRHELASEGIRLARVVHAVLPDNGDVTGLLALMVLTDARRLARTGPGGELIPLAEQDRSRWDQAMIEEGVALAILAMTQGPTGDYQLQAAIAALHDEAPTAGETDWCQILALYGVLERMTGNPMVSLNRAVAAAMVHGPSAGLERLAPLEESLAGHYRLDAVRAHLLERAGDTAGAIAAYLRAAQGTLSLPERRYLIAKAATLS